MDLLRPFVLAAAICAASVFAGATPCVSPARASEEPAFVLVMVEQAGCHWCARWNEEIGGAYGKTREGRVAPLRRVDLRKLPDDLAFSEPPRYTPTFVLFSGGRETGRIEGYPGEDFFYPLLARLLARPSTGGGS